MIAKGPDNICSRVAKLWEATKRLLGEKIQDYTDESWLDEDEDVWMRLSVDEQFAYILTWSHHNLKVQASDWAKVRASLRGRRLTDIQNATEVGQEYPVPWQKHWFQRLIDYLKSGRISTDNFVRLLRSKGRREAKNVLMKVVQTESEKIVECWLRDIIRLPAFPIDSNVRNPLQKFGILDDSDSIVDCCQALGIPASQFARAVYDNADSLATDP